MQRIGILLLLGATYFAVVALGASLKGDGGPNLAFSVWIVASVALIIASMVWNPRPGHSSILVAGAAATVPIIEIGIGFVVVVNILEWRGVAH